MAQEKPIDAAATNRTRPNPSLDELQSANRVAQQSSREFLSAAGWTYPEAIDVVDAADRLRGVKLAWLNNDRISVRASHETNAHKALREKFGGDAVRKRHDGREVRFVVDLNKVEA